MTEQVGTNTNFDMPVDELIDFALEGLGGEHISYSDAKNARLALNLIFIDLQNRGMAPLASMQLTTVALVSGSADNYYLGSAVFNVLDAVIQISASGGSTDLPMDRLSYTEWLEIPTKSTSKGRPTQYLVNKQRNGVEVNVWPKPESNKYSLKAWTLNRIADVDGSYQLIDLPHRYLPAIVKGLRYYMADLRSAPLDERQWFKNEYLETLQVALDEDRERVSFDVYPSNKKQL